MRIRQTRFKNTSVPQQENVRYLSYITVLYIVPICLTMFRNVTLAYRYVGKAVESSFLVRDLYCGDISAAPNA